MFRHKPKKVRKAWLDVVAIYNPDRAKKFSALMQSIMSSSDMSAYKSWSRTQESIHLNALESFGKRHIPKKTGLKRT